VQQRLEDNKRFAARNAKVPSLLQGLAACSACGYYRASDPVTRQRTQRERALDKAATSITAMIGAYAEQLITIDELRTRMPDLRAREASLRGQLDALDAQAADRDAYLKLADDLESFLAHLRASAATASTSERQRVLRLLVKDVLIGPEKISIRHRIPAREPAGSGGGHHDSTDTEGDMRQSYPLCWGRGRCSLWRPGALAPDPLLHDPRGQPLTDQPQDPLIRDPVPEEPRQPAAINAGEKVADIRVQHPVHLLPLDPDRQRV